MTRPGSTGPSRPGRSGRPSSPGSGPPGIPARSLPGTRRRRPSGSGWAPRTSSSPTPPSPGGARTGGGSTSSWAPRTRSPAIPLPSVEELDRTHFPDPYQRWPQGELRPGMRGARGVDLPEPQEPPGRRRAEGDLHPGRDAASIGLSGQLASTFRFEPTSGSRSMHGAEQKIRSRRSCGGQAAEARIGSLGALVRRPTGPTRNDPDAWRKVLRAGDRQVSGGHGFRRGHVRLRPGGPLREGREPHRTPPAA